MTRTPSRVDHGAGDVQGRIDTLKRLTVSSEAERLRLGFRQKPGPARQATSAGPIPSRPLDLESLELETDHRAERAEPSPAAHKLATAASAKLRAALLFEESEAAEVRNFLVDSGLHSYADAFIENGFDCMDVVQEMEEHHMRDLGMKNGHMIKLKLRLASRASSSQHGLAMKPGMLAETMQEASRSATSQSHKFEAPRMMPASPVQPSRLEEASSCLLHGELDEAAEAAAFREAVEAWRHGRAESQASAVIRMPVQEVSPSHSPATSKRCCYQCYRQFLVPVDDASPQEGSSPSFCSETCAESAQEAQRRKEEAKQKKFAELQQT
eukprot:s2973_g3.t1